MRIAERVVFGGGAGALDRAADRRARPEEMARLLAHAAARVLPLWRGRPLLRPGPPPGLGWLPVGHLLLEGAEAPLFLGLASEGDPSVSGDPGDAGGPSGGAGPRFATDLSAWTPGALGAPGGLGAPGSPGVVDPAGDSAAWAAAPQAHPLAPDGFAFAELRAAAPGLTPREAELAATARALTGWHATHRFCARCGTASEPAQAGWQRLCPACGAHHFPRTDPVVIMLVTHGEAVLLGRSPGWPEGMFSLLAGFVEPGETIEAAVRREVFEETGVRVAEVGYLASQPWPFPASLMIGCRGRALGRDLTLDPVEIEDAAWLTREEVAAAFAGRHERVRPPREGAIAGFLLRAWLADRLG